MSPGKVRGLRPPTPLPSPVEMFIYNSLPAPPPPVVCQPPCQSKHTRPLQTGPEHDFRKKRTLSSLFPLSLAQTLPPFSSLPLPLSQWVFQRVTLMERKGKRGDRRKEGGGRGSLHPAWAAKLVSEQQLDSGDARHTLPTSCVCFCGV